MVTFEQYHGGLQRSRRPPYRAYANVSTNEADEMGNSASYLDEMYKIWRDDPDSVHASWRVYFRNLEDPQKPVWQAFSPPPGFLSSREIAHVTPSAQQSITRDVNLGTKHQKVQLLVRAYQMLGYRHAKIDPLGIRQNTNVGDSAELCPAYHGLTHEDMVTEFELGSGLLPGFLIKTRTSMSLKDIIVACQSLYCSTYGVEFQHITDPIKREWLRQRLEIQSPIKFSKAEKYRILHELMLASTFERLLAAKAPNDKRFGLDGAEALAPAMSSLIDRSVDTHSVDNIIIGSCHRGRLTMMGTIYGKPYESIFAEFAGKTRFEPTHGMTGDVKSHLGVNSKRTTNEGRQVSLSLLSNPSHLETVDPVAAGKTFATQRLLDDRDCKRVLCVTLHGDAAFAGQGVVYEVLNMSQVPIYDVGGTIRIIVNNQLGFTTDPSATRSTAHCSDIAKFVEAPIFHVNGDDPEATTFMCQLAADWRATFHSDCVVDIVCYRRFGHQELDLPNLTQPVMYEKIRAHTPLLEQYAAKVLAEGSITQAELDSQQKEISDQLNRCYLASKNYEPASQPHPTSWQHLLSPEEAATTVPAKVVTAADADTLKGIAHQVLAIPEGFEVHKSLRRIFEGRRAVFDQGWVDWAAAETLAIGTLCMEGHHCRLTGQDIQRGTFAHRHSVLHDQKTGRTWTPLDELSKDQARFSVANSPLSEYGPVGFEYGFTLADPTSLVVWEAQFGDFANNTQVIIDNLIATGEAKWMDRSGLVLSLPHGYDGQGPEHSSARLERFLQLCNEDGRNWPAVLERQHQECNMQVTYITSPANLFHALRRQIHREYRKPLVILFSKSLLRHALTVSDLNDFTNGSSFQPLLLEQEHGRSIEPPECIDRVIFCTGQVYAALQKHRGSAGIRNAAITRLEELHPFPWQQVQDNLKNYPNAKSIVWAQEEPYNGGAWQYVRDRFETILHQTDGHQGRSILYAGRPPSAATAVGGKWIHEEQQKKLLEDAFSVL